MGENAQQTAALTSPADATGLSVARAAGHKPTAAMPCGQYGALLIDPPWRFSNRTGKVAPEHKRLKRYETMSFEEIEALPVGSLAKPQSHLYLWSPNALLPEALRIMQAWGFTYKTNLVWLKVRKDGGPDGRGVGFYFRNVTENLLFGVKGKLRTLAPGRRQVNAFMTRKEQHSKKPDLVYDVIQRCSPGPYLEMFARTRVAGWEQWGDQLDLFVVCAKQSGQSQPSVLPLHAGVNVATSSACAREPYLASAEQQPVASSAVATQLLSAV